MAKTNKFGTFGGVFVPSILTILGVIMYLRLPMIVGEAGLWATIGIIVVAHIISVTTGLSVSSIATDKKVAAGGTYYMISRSLGLPIGGTLGLALFVGLSFSVSLYLIGFSESFLSYWGLGTDINNIRLTGSIVLLAVTTLTFISTSLAIKTQYFIMAAIVLSLVSILFGKHDLPPSAPLFNTGSSTVPLMVLFGIFFPAVTGFEAGVSMSGDLKDPKKSIPAGSIMAITVGFIVYIFLAFFFTYTVDGTALADDDQILLKIAWIPELVIAGIWGATLSSALGSILGAPRILQATALDRITPTVFGKGYGATNEPRNALILTFIIAEAGILIGELNVIARIVSIFFITTYGFLNISAAFERWTSADFRPEFKIPGWISLIGAIACMIVMIQLDFIAMLGAVIILTLVYLLLKRKELKLDSGDAWSGVWASLVKAGLTHLTKDRLHSRNWRPNIIMFSGNPANRKHLVDMGKAIAGKLGILSAFELVKSDQKILARSESNLEKEKDASGYFRHKLNCADIYQGMDQVARVYGFSGIEPNTILMGWSQESGNQDKFITLIEGFGRNQYNTVFLNHTSEAYGNYMSIDVWWGGEGRNLSLAIHLIKQLSNSLLWQKSRIRLLVIAPIDGDQEEMHGQVQDILDHYRVEAQIQIIEQGQSSEKEIIASTSAQTDLTILEIPEKHFSRLDKYYTHINEVISGLNTTMIIHASKDFDEYEVLSKSKSQEVGEWIDEEALRLDAIEPSVFQEVTAQLVKIDTNGQKAIDVFYGKSLNRIYDDHQQVLQVVSDRLAGIESELTSIQEIPESLRRKKAIDKLKSETLYKLQSLISDEIKKEQLEKHPSLLEEQLTWYIDKLERDFRLYPKKLAVIYRKEDFAVHTQDAWSVKLYKRWKRLLHRLFKSSFKSSLPYRELARFYQLNNRLVFLKAYVQKFLQEEEQFYYDLRKQLISIIQQLDKIESKIWSGEEWTDQVAPLVEKASTTQQKLANQNKLFHARAKVEFRKNLMQMAQEMERLGVNQSLKKMKRPSKYYAQVRKEVLEMGAQYEAEVGTLLNMLAMELSVNQVINRQERAFEQFHRNLYQTIKNNYLKKLENLIQSVSDGETEAFEKPKIDIDFDAVLLEDFGQHMDRMIAQTEQMPETVEIYSQHIADQEERDTQEIPVARMAEYYMKSRYETPLEGTFDQLIESLKRSVFSVQDAISLVHFDKEDPKAEPLTDPDEIATKCQAKLKEELFLVEEYLISFKEKAAEALQMATSPLSTLHIRESAEEFNAGFRGYQGQQVLSGAGAVFQRISTAVQKQLSRIWLGKSTALLRAKKEFDRTDLRSVNSALLDLHDQLSPKAAVLPSLPQYYVSLFNGKSNIGRDFWIKRPIEEEIFRKAHRRFKAGVPGGILLLGSRNSGKTAFARHITQVIMKLPNTYTVYPPIGGSVQAKDFTVALAKSTQKQGSPHQMIASLPQDAVIIINDLELFWERSEEGMEVIEQVRDLMDRFGHKVLFMVNMNPYAYRLIHQMTNFGQHFLEVIPMQPFHAEELQELVLKRHKSSGIAFGYDPASGSLNELQTASLFDSYFTLSRGNPGAALNGWLSHITKASSDFIQIKKPINPSLAVFKQIDSEWLGLLTQFVLHKRLSSIRISRIFDWSLAKAKRMLLALIRSGLIVEKSADVYHINPYLYPFVLSYLEEKEVIR